MRADLNRARDYLREWLGDLHDVHPRLKWRRATWFVRVERRFDLVSFAAIASWCAREKGGFSIDQVRREQALQTLETSIFDGEFGPPGKPALAYMPGSPDYPIPTNLLGRYRFRYSDDDVAAMRQWGKPVAEHLWVPKALARRWFAARQIELPPWLGASAPLKSGPVAGPTANDPTAICNTLEPKVSERPKIPRSKLVAEFNCWVNGRSGADFPTKEEANQWALDNQYSTEEVRKLQRAGTPRGRGRPPNK